MSDSSFTRRSFLRAGAAGVASAALARSGVGFAAPRRKKRVVILGAGLAGLATAHELQKMHSGAEIVILEGQDRVGGRILTVRSHMNRGETPFADGQYVEAGAHRIPDTHDRTLTYAKELGLRSKVVEFSNALDGGKEGATMYLLKDERFLFDGAKWPSVLDFTPEERVTPFFPQDVKYEYRWVTGKRPPKGTNHLGNPAIPPYQRANWPYGDGIKTTLDRWNKFTLEEFLDRRGASADWRRLLYVAENGSEILSTTALAWLIQSALDSDWDKTFYLDGGLDQIPEGLATTVSDRGASLRLNSPVVALEQNAAGAVVTYRDPSNTIRRIAADRVVVTAPFPVLRKKVDLSRARFAADKRFWIKTLKMMPVTRLSLQVNDRFWRNHGVEGLKMAGTDQRYERIWHSTNTQAGDSGIMQAYAQHRNALYAGAQPNKLAWLRDQVAQGLFPEVATAWNGLGMEKMWHLDEWAGGGWVSPKRNQFLQGFRVWGRAEGRIHFAGDSTSLLAGWMQGGIESGQRAACEVITAL